MLTLFAIVVIVVITAFVGGLTKNCFETSEEWEHTPKEPAVKGMMRNKNNISQIFPPQGVNLGKSFKKKKSKTKLSSRFPPVLSLFALDKTLHSQAPSLSCKNTDKCVLVKCNLGGNPTECGGYPCVGFISHPGERGSAASLSFKNIGKCVPVKCNLGGNPSECGGIPALHLYPIQGRGVRMLLSRSRTSVNM